jgi:glycosyltransferase involved in cell wall biosynthesis
MRSPKLSVCCCTFLRPAMLQQVIDCFKCQDYTNAELIVLVDAGQYQQVHTDNIHVISIDRRFHSLGEKRNACVALAGESDGLVMWDDDDLYKPWALSAIADGLKQCEFVNPSWIYHLEHRVSTRGGCYHPAWGFTRSLFYELGGYTPVNVGEDDNLLQKVMKKGIRIADPMTRGYDPYFIWRTEKDSYSTARDTQCYHNLAQSNEYKNRKRNIRLDVEQKRFPGTST